MGMAGQRARRNWVSHPHLKDGARLEERHPSRGSCPRQPQKSKYAGNSMPTLPALPSWGWGLKRRIKLNSLHLRKKKKILKCVA